MIRMGLVGAGAIAAEHARAMSALPDVTLSMVYNPRPARAQELAARHGAIACATLEQLIAGVDAVDICSPTNVHAEKPIALSVADGERMVAAAEAAGTVFLVAHVLRFWPEYRVVQRLIAAGDLGVPRAAVAWRLNAPCLHRPWYYRPAQSGGAVVDLLIHDLDLYHWLFGPLGHVQAQGRRDDAGAWQHVQALLGYRGGVLATAEASFLMPVDYPPRFYCASTWRVAAWSTATAPRRGVPWPSCAPAPRSPTPRCRRMTASRPRSPTSPPACARATGRR
jgi:predicted dehydrogenase